MPDCGTYAALSRHKRLGEPVDPPCRAAGAAYQRVLRLKSGPDGRAARREHKRAYDRALARLRDRHRGQFAAMLREEVARAADDRLAQARTSGTDDSWWEAPDG